MESKISVTYEKSVDKVELTGHLDASNAPKLQEDLKKLIGKPVDKIVFFVKELEYISSAGLRVIIFAKQKLGAEARIFLIGATKEVADVIKMSGLDNFLTIRETDKD